MSHTGFFVRAREQQKLWTEREKVKVDGGGASALSGEEVMTFYQSLFEEDGGRRGRGDGGGARGGADREGGGACRRRRRERGGAAGGRGGADGGCRTGAGGAGESSVPLAGRTEGYRLLRCAAQGHAPVVEELLRCGCRIDFRDEFNWTALMSASYSGRSETVRLLLQRGATWRGIVDQQRRDARDLARLAGHHHIVTQLEQHDCTHTPAQPTHSPPAVSQWCEVCEVCYTEGSHTHGSSTLHQFNLNRPPAAPHYCLAPSSAGYRMMLRLGWDPRSGLGPAHDGRTRPIGTVLKQDRAGVGFGEAPRSKVTHFGARDTGAVRREAKQREESRDITRRERRRREERERQWERDYRASFNAHS